MLGTGSRAPCLAWDQSGGRQDKSTKINVSEVPFNVHSCNDMFFFVLVHLDLAAASEGPSTYHLDLTANWLDYLRKLLPYRQKNNSWETVSGLLSPSALSSHIKDWHAPTGPSNHTLTPLPTSTTPREHIRPAASLTSTVAGPLYLATQHDKKSQRPQGPNFNP